MKRCVAVIPACVCFIMALAGCSPMYDTRDFIGKTSAEIVSEYGVFDCTFMPAGEDGIYKSCKCGYTIKEARKSLLGTQEEVLIFIEFDDNGIAVNCEKGYRPGG